MKHIGLRIFFAFVMLAAVGGIAFIAYNAGVTHSTTTAIQAPVAQTGSQANPVYITPYWFPFPFFGFGFFSFLAVLCLFWVAFGAARFVLFGPRWGWRRRYGAWGNGGTGEGVPPMWSEMHRRMHAADQDKPADQATQK